MEFARYGSRGIALAQTPRDYLSSRRTGTGGPNSQTLVVWHCEQVYVILFRFAPVLWSFKLEPHRHFRTKPSSLSNSSVFVFFPKKPKTDFKTERTIDFPSLKTLLSCVRSRRLQSWYAGGLGGCDVFGQLSPKTRLIHSITSCTNWLSGVLVQCF